MIAQWHHPVFKIYKGSSLISVALINTITQRNLGKDGDHLSLYFQSTLREVRAEVDAQTLGKLLLTGSLTGYLHYTILTCLPKDGKLHNRIAPPT